MPGIATLCDFTLAVSRSTFATPKYDRFFAGDRFVFLTRKLAINAPATCCSPAQD